MVQSNSGANNVAKLLLLLLGLVPATLYGTLALYIVALLTCLPADILKGLPKLKGP